MRVLVTGGSGFIGSHVVDELRDRGVTVRVFDMVYPTWRDDIEFYKGSILDLEDLHMAMNKVDAVIHMAAAANVNEIEKEPHRSENINVRGTMNVLEAMRRGGVDRMVYASTTWVYSDVEDEEVDETTALQAPSHLYTATKIAGEHYCKAYRELYDLDTTIVRYGIPYGPRARPAGVIPIFTRLALDGEPLTIEGDGTQYRKFVYVEDLARGTVKALRPDAKNKIYNLDGDEKVTINQIAETVQEVVGDVEITHEEARAGDFGGKEVDSTRARKELGWEPTVPFEEGLRRYIEWYQEEQEEREARWEKVDDGLTS